MVFLYLAESGELTLPLVNGCDLSHIAKSTHIVKEFSYLECMTEVCNQLRYGMTLELSTDNNSWDLWTSFLAASPVKISALQELEKAWKESEADFFLRSCAFPKKSSPSSYSLKTSQQSQAEADFESLEKLPKWGMIVDGVLYPLQALERHTVAKDGSYLPTPRAKIGKDCPSERKRNDPSWESLVAMIHEKKLPTPQACDATKGPAKEYIPNGKQSSMRNLVTLAARFSTTGKILNPQFVEWLMGYPIGYTELEPLETQSCPPKLEKLFASCRVLDKNKAK